MCHREGRERFVSTCADQRRRLREYVVIETYTNRLGGDTISVLGRCLATIQSLENRMITLGTILLFVGVIAKSRSVELGSVVLLLCLVQPCLDRRSEPWEAGGATTDD